MLLYKVQFSTQKDTNFHIWRHNHHQNAGIRSHAEAPWENTKPCCFWSFPGNLRLAVLVGFPCFWLQNQGLDEQGDRAIARLAEVLQPETIGGSRYRKWREMSRAILLLLFPQEKTKLKSAQKFPRHFSPDTLQLQRPESLSGLPNANAKSQRFSNVILQIATLPPVVALNRRSKSQIAARYAAFWHAISQIAVASFL